MRSTFGSTLVALYYRLSPPIAQFLCRNAGLRVCVKERIANPIVKWIERRKDRLTEGSAARG